jgi:hypothetical protein
MDGGRVSSLRVYTSCYFSKIIKKLGWNLAA